MKMKELVVKVSEFVYICDAVGTRYVLRPVL